MMFFRSVLLGSVVFRFGSRRSSFRSSFRLSGCGGGAGRGDLLVPFVIPLVLVVSRYFNSAGRRFSSSFVRSVLQVGAAFLSVCGALFSRLISFVVRCRCLVIVCGELDGTARSHSLVISYSIPDDAMPIAGSCRIHCRTLRPPACLARCLTYRSPFLPSYRSPVCLSSPRSSSRRAVRAIVSSCHLPIPIQSHMRRGFGCLLAVLSSHRACRPAMPCLRRASSHRLSSRSPPPRSSTRKTGREAGSVGVLLARFRPCGLCRCR